MDKIPTTVDWRQLFQRLPEELEVLRIEEAETDGLFALEAWAPRDVHELAKLLMKFPAKTTLEKIVNEVEGDICISLWIPKITVDLEAKEA